MAATERQKFQQDIQRVEQGYKMLSDIESKLNGYFKSTTSTHSSQGSVGGLHKPPISGKETKVFSEFNFKPQLRNYTSSENRSINIVDSVPLVERSDNHLVSGYVPKF
jgi:hypothetical protein